MIDSKGSAGRSMAAPEVVILVLGMGRSGSSALARVLSLCGWRLPAELLPANRWNPAGYWEPDAAVHANARFLQASGSSFFDTQLAQRVSDDAPLGRRFIEEIAGFLQECRDPASSQPLIVKEPRISLLLPFWLAATEAARFSPRVVIPVRHPSEVAASLGEWKGLPETHTAELWLKYNLLAERHTRHLPRAFVSYARLLADWRREVLAISEALGVQLTPNPEVDEFLNPQLRHRTSEDETAASRTPWLAEVYDAFSRACRGGEPDVELLDAAYRDLSQAQAAGARLVVRSFGTDFGAL